MFLIDYCAMFDNALIPEVCDEIIKMFHENEQLHERYDRNSTPNFTQLNFTSHKDINLPLHSYLEEKALESIKAYKSIVKETKHWPSKYGFEEFRIKHYKNDGIDQFAEHIDAGQLKTSKRFFAFFWYLNDVEEGGETEFLNIDLKLKPKKGSLFMFPPLWMYPHKGNPPISNDKYLLSSYLHFTE